MKLMIDTNVVLDCLLERESSFDDSLNLIISLAQKEFDGVLTAKSVADVYYFARKQIGDEEKARDVIRRLVGIFIITETNCADCINALHMEGPDYEDNMIISAAERIGADVILTRNLKDFKHSPIPAQLPGEFFAAQDYNSGKVSKLKQIIRTKH